MYMGISFLGSVYFTFQEMLEKISISNISEHED